MNIPRYLDLYRKQNIKNSVINIFLLLLLIITLLINISFGESIFWPNQWWTSEAKLFVWQLRIPRALAVITVGAGLAVSGAIMQAIFGNPLSEPALLGVANGAGVALVATLLLSAGTASVLLLNITAIGGALFINLLLLLFSRIFNLSTAKLLLTGIAFSIICSALMTWAVYFSNQLNLRQLMYWLMGSFSGIDWRQLWLIVLMIPVIIWICLQGKVVNLLALGELQAWQLGTPVIVWRNLFIIAVAWLVGLSVALAGTISFIGLIVPHLLRFLGVTDHRSLLCSSMLSGATLLLLADLLARTLLDSAELPIGVVTASIGAPLFIWMLLRYAHF